MSAPRYDWWPYVKGMIRRYPELCSRVKLDRENPRVEIEITEMEDKT